MPKETTPRPSRFTCWSGWRPRGKNGREIGFRKACERAGLITGMESEMAMLARWEGYRQRRALQERRKQERAKV